MTGVPVRRMTFLPPVFSMTCRDLRNAEIPRWLRWRLEGFGDDKDALQAFGTDVVTDLCNTLLEAGAPGLHFYTMNQFGPTLAIWQNLGLDEL